MSKPTARFGKSFEKFLYSPALFTHNKIRTSIYRSRKTDFAEQPVHAVKLPFTFWTDLGYKKLPSVKMTEGSFLTEHNRLINWNLSEFL